MSSSVISHNIFTLPSQRIGSDCLLLNFFSFFFLSLIFFCPPPPPNFVTTVVSDLPMSAIELAQPDNTSQWLRNLEVDFDAVHNTSANPCSSHIDRALTPALPETVVELDRTLTPQCFEPGERDNSCMISDPTYDKISNFSFVYLLIARQRWESDICFYFFWL